MKKYARILFHDVQYWYEDNESKELAEDSRERIVYMINDGKSSGELYSYDNETDQEYYGWWQIKGYETN